MGSVHLEPIVFVVRVFPPGKSFGDKYEASFTLQKIGRSMFGLGLTGTVRPAAYREFLKRLKEMDCDEFIMERHGVMKTTVL